MINVSGDRHIDGPDDNNNDDDDDGLGIRLWIAWMEEWNIRMEQMHE